MRNPVSRLRAKSHDVRREILEMCVRAGKGHVTSSLSAADVLVALYYGGIMHFRPSEPDWEDRDRLIVSKGQASPALYVVLADLGYFHKKELSFFAQKKGKFSVHLQQDVPGVEITVGSLGQGFGIAAGMALALKVDRKLPLVYCLLGDGECYEGSVWETAMFASHNRLNNLVTIVDRNYQCVTDFTENVVALEPLADKWRAFGFNVLVVDGHCLDDLLKALKPLRSRPSDKPTVVIACTVKGQGVERLCYDPLWHGCAPGGAVARECYADLEKGVNRE
jgi:transketolase